jgi:taurine dioxygenase
MKLTPLSSALGALIEDFDPRNGGDEEWEALNEALYARHHLLVFRGLKLSDDEHVDLCARFGQLGLVGQESSQGFSYISNVRPDGILGEIAASWHFDYAFTSCPLDAISLYGIEIPKTGTQTWFANAKAAAANLPDELKTRVAGMTVRNAVDVTAPERERGIRVRMKRLDESFPHYNRAVLWPHWKTGEAILSVNQQQSDAILQMPPEESSRLIEMLFDHLYSPEHVHVHEWRQDDLVIWDNHALHHARPEVGLEHARTLRRISIGQSPDLSIFAKRKDSSPAASLSDRGKDDLP